MIRILLSLLAVAVVQAQPSRTLADDPWCEVDHSDDLARSCEVREYMVRADDLDLDATPNGSVSVKRWDRSDVLVRARVEAYAHSEDRARELRDEVEVEVDEGHIRADTNADGSRRSEGSGVSYEVFAPRQTGLSIRTQNGSAVVHGIDGDVDVESVNGSISLSDMAGSVFATSVNGSVSVELSGGTWAGSGLAARTTNGSVLLKVPSGFSADLHARTQVGRIALTGLDVARHDRRRGRQVGDQIETRIGRGGAPVELTTVNGSVRIEQVR